jgi:hypothetical protein
MGHTQRALFVAVAAIAFPSNTVDGQRSQSAGSRFTIVGARRLTNPGSTCDLPKPVAPSEVTYLPNAVTTMRGCLDLDSTRLVPVLVKLSARDSVVAVVLPALTSVWLGSARDSSAAVALWLRVGGRGGFVTELKGLEIPLVAHASLELLYLFPTTARGSTLTLGSLGHTSVSVP